MTIYSIKEIQVKNSYIKLDTIKNFLRIDGDDEEDILSLLLEAAVAQFEKYTNKIIKEKEFEIIYRDTYYEQITLPFTPLIEIMNIQRKNIGGEWYELKSDLYETSESTIYFKTIVHNKFLKIRCKTGMAKLGEEIPDEIQALLLRHIAHLYEQKNEIDNKTFEFPVQIYNSFKNIKLN